MNKNLAKLFYNKQEIQKVILDFAKFREIGMYFDGYYGKRPEQLEFLSDVKEFVDKGIFSFHASEERWTNPMLLSNDKISLEEKSKNRIGWDLILDLDGLDFEYSKILGKVILDFLFELKVKNISIKFSGNKGFHIGIPFEAFSGNILGIGKTKDLFPEAPKRIALFLMYELREKLSKIFIDKFGSIEFFANKHNLDIKDLILKINGKTLFNFMKIIEIDTILITSRHLFRMPFSLNEKSGLVSVPIKNLDISNFSKKMAHPDIVNPKDYIGFEFLKYESKFGCDADILLIKAYEDDFSDMVSLKIMESSKKNEIIFEINGKIDIKDFPKTIQYVLNNNFVDGRKRAIFLLLSFLYGINFKKKEILEIIEDWNKKQTTPLKIGYIKAQISWFNINSKRASTPNFSNDLYYRNIGIPKEIILSDINKFRERKIKNPLHFSWVFLNKKNKAKK